MFLSVTFYYEDYYSIYFVRRDDDRGNHNDKNNNYFTGFSSEFPIYIDSFSIENDNLFVSRSIWSI